MRRLLPLLALVVTWTGVAHGHGLLIPDEKTVPPLAMVNHKVNITIEDQIAITKVDQTFRNHTPRALEATYVFPVPKGAKVDKFTMWVNGKEISGELVEADKARQIYESIVRRVQDPGLLEYMGNDLFKLRVFPIPANGEQRVTLQYKSIAGKEAKLVEYIYPLKTDGKATATLDEFSITATIKSQHNVTNVYSPTHALRIDRVSDREVKVAFEKQQGLLDKDFQLFYGTGDKDVGLTVLTHRPIAAEKGYFTLLISPKVEIPKEYQVPRDIVMVLDTSGSMRGVKMTQAQKAMKYCLNNLSSKDRFAMINFATSVSTWRDSLTDAGADELKAARKWVDELDATGGTAINDALARALEFRPAKDEGRTFTIIFFTDGVPTIGETNCDKILKNTLAKNTSNTRVFTFGVGDDVNASFLDQLAEQTRALSTYVRPAEDIEAKTSALYAKISNPVLANLKLTTTADIRFDDMYPVQLPDLFHGNQLIVMGRYSGKGATAIKLTGQVGKETKDFVYEFTFPEKTEDGHEFVEELWARRKVGFLLDQIRANGQKKELVDEVVLLAKKYGITTPYTSYLIVPDGPVSVVRDPKLRTKPGAARGGEEAWGLSKVKTPDGKPTTVEDYARLNQPKPGELEKNRERLAGDDLKSGGKDGAKGDQQAAKEAEEKKEAYDKARTYFYKRQLDEVQSGKLGVDLAIYNANLRTQCRLENTASRYVNGRNCLEVGGVWIDEGFVAKMKTLTIKAQSDAYFRLLEKQPKMRDVLKLGNHLVWVAPNGTALIIDTKVGKDKLDDKEIDALFVAKVGTTK
jgi:Ca-activated chloride channel family protein